MATVEFSKFAGILNAALSQRHLSGFEIAQLVFHACTPRDSRVFSNTTVQKHQFFCAQKASGGDGIPVELFQILKDDSVKVLHSICQQIWKTQQWPEDWKRSVFIPIPKKGNAKECSNYCTMALISHTNKVMLKILQVSM